MNRRLLAFTIAVLALAGARRVAAQEVEIGYQGLPYKAANESKTGINLAEGVLLHVGAGVEGGWDSNVFYGSTSAGGAGTISSGIFRFTAFSEISNGSRAAGVSGAGVNYDVRAGLVYRRYTSNNDFVKPFANAFMPSAGLSLGTSSGPWSFTLTDSFLRQEDPPYQGVTAGAANPISRDDNVAAVQVGWAPGGGRITTTLRYTNTLDFFESSSGFSYASSLAHNVMLDVSWKWLPKTALFINLNQGWVTYLNETEAKNAGTGKTSSYPLHAAVGLRGLITPKLTATASLGYMNAFTSSGESTGGFWGSSYLDLQAIMLPTLMNRITVGYHQDFQNSVISSFYYDYSVYASLVQQLGGRLAVDISARLSHRQYEGLLFDPMNPNGRTDNAITAGATVDYFVRNWAYVGAGYSLVADLSDYRLPVTNTPVDYVKHQVFARLGISY
jgi:hypothetical protein